MILKRKKQATPKMKPVPFKLEFAILFLMELLPSSPFKLEFAILFLMELLPSRAPLCFRLRGKGTSYQTDGQK